jgi:L-alanine-DL-glutamate epimerase-like enolase superfamily enzyme
MASYDAIADLPLVIEGYELEERSRWYGAEFERVTVTYHLHGGQHEGLGEDVGWFAQDQRAQVARTAKLPLAGEWTLDSFVDQVGAIDLFPAGAPTWEVFRHYRRWAIESAALDLALRQAGTSLAAAFGRTPQPVAFVVSNGLGSPPSLEPVARRLAAYPGTRFKLDATPEWDRKLIDGLVETGAVAVIDFKGAYRGTPVDVETDPALYRRVAEAFPEAWLEDPDLGPPEAMAALRPFRERITWDAVIHSVADVRALPFPPRTLNVKPSRLGAIRDLFAFYDMCAQEGIGLYSGGQAELGVGRGQAQYLSALFHPGSTNDIAPTGWDWEDFPETGLPTSPLDPAIDSTGFRRRS